MKDLTAIITQALEMVRIKPLKSRTSRSSYFDDIPWAISDESIKLIAPELAKQITEAGYVKVTGENRLLTQAEFESAEKNGNWNWMEDWIPILKAQDRKTTAYYQKKIAEIFIKIDGMELIKNHNGHKKGEVMLVSCARCSYDLFKKKYMGGEK
jgi:hypothetical protein